MSNNPGKREREARKRHRRVWLVEKVSMVIHANHAYFLNYPEAEAVPLKLGRKHYRARIVATFSAVADSRKTGGGRALESAGRTLPNVGETI
jgi:hypothetical protein